MMRFDPTSHRLSGPDSTDLLARREFLARSSFGLGAMALATMSPSHAAAERIRAVSPRAKRVIFLFMSGGPSHVDLFDPKPLLRERDGQPMPPEIIKNHVFAMIKTARPSIKGSPFRFERHGESGNEFSELLPHIASVGDELAIVRSVHTDTFNHDPACTFLNTGDVRFGRPSMGAWLSYGLGSETEDFPAYCVLISGQKGQPLLESYWGAGFLPSRHQGVQLRSRGEPVLFAKSPAGFTKEMRREQIDLVSWMNSKRFEKVGDPEILARISQYELAFRMQTAVPDTVDLSHEPTHVHEAYGTDLSKPAYANNCLLARRLVERGVRFVQLYHRGWDSHGSIEKEHRSQCAEVDRPTAALLRDLKDRGLLEDTLVVWGGEFGRTPVAQGSGGGYGRDHHPYGFTMWLAGGGIRPGVTHGSTDEFGYFAVEDKVHVHDVQATILHCLGLDHERLTYRFQGRDFRLTDVHGSVVRQICSS